MDEARVKIILFEEDEKTKTLIFCRELNQNNIPISLKCNFQDRGYNEIYHHKTLNYLENVFYRQEIQKTNFNDYLYISSDNKILETSIHNIFFIKNKTIYTPKKKLPILLGIIRDKIINNKYIKVIEIDLFPEDLSNFDAVFVTNSIQGIIPVTKIAQVEFDVKIVEDINRNLKEKSVVL